MSRNKLKNKMKLYKAIKELGKAKFYTEVVEDHPCEAHLRT